MRAYEVMYILVPTLDADSADQLARRIAETVQRAGGEVSAVEPWGKRRLAYEIKGHREGIYYVMRFRSEIEVPKELRRVLGLSEQVLRALVMRQEEAPPADAGIAEEDGAAEAEAEPEEAEAAAEPAEATVVEES